MNTPTPFDFDSLHWFKASASSDNGACVEVAQAPAARVCVRDSKVTTGPKLSTTNKAFTSFIDAIRTDTI